MRYSTKMDSRDQLSIDDIIIYGISSYMPFSTIYMLAKMGDHLWIKAATMQMKNRSTREISLVAIVHDDRVLMRYILSPDGLERRVTDEMVTLAIQEYKYLALDSIVQYTRSTSASKRVVAWSSSLQNLYRYGDILLLKAIHTKFEIPFDDLRVDWEFMSDEMSIDKWLSMMGKIVYNYYIIKGAKLYKYLTDLPDDIFFTNSKKIYQILESIQIPIYNILLYNRDNTYVKENIDRYCRNMYPN